MASPTDLPYNPTNVLSGFTITFEVPPPTGPHDTTRYFTDATISDLQKHGNTICNICQEQLGGLSAEDIQRIAPDEATHDSTATSITSDTNTDPNTNEDSPVCVRPSKLSCGHVFGRECLKEWLNTSDTCPMCRDEVSSTRWEDDIDIYDDDDEDSDLENDEDFQSGYLLALEDDLDSDAEEQAWAYCSAEDEEGDAEAVEAEDCTCMWFAGGQGLPMRVVMCESCTLSEEAVGPEDDSHECTCRWFLNEQGMLMRDGTCESCVISGRRDD